LIAPPKLTTILNSIVLPRLKTPEKGHLHGENSRTIQRLLKKGTTMLRMGSRSEGIVNPHDRSFHGTLRVAQWVSAPLRLACLSLRRNRQAAGSLEIGGLSNWRRTGMKVEPREFVSTTDLRCRL
jgi:hypothetical protein